MKELILKQIDVFSTAPFCGNPALVATGAEGLSPEEMQRVAAEMNILESTYVTRPHTSDADFRVKFFTPSNEYDFSGHAMIATCFALAEEGMVTLAEGVTTKSFETNAGVMPVDFHFEEGDDCYGTSGPDSMPLNSAGTPGALKKIMIHRSIDRFRAVDTTVSEIASTLGIPESDITMTGLPVEIVFNGVYQLVIPVYSSGTLASMCPDLIKLKLLNLKMGVQTTDIFTTDALNEDCICYSRHFSPAMGMWEDLGSGAGGASIAAYMLRHGVITSQAAVMEQGPEADKLSRVHVDVRETNGEAIAVQVGGLAVTSMTRTATIQDNNEIVVV
ncbi:MAG: PhzF family phenazine biosynthesis protein [Candidatus Krumholzibacteria bacterium]|nr:PhzF family phenazine biosynthesis protein [Candidatus Krumholzibacteria bacterium]